MTEEGHFYLLEANPNPQIAHNEDLLTQQSTQVFLRPAAAEDHDRRAQLSGTATRLKRLAHLRNPPPITPL